MSIVTINPTTGTDIARYELHTADDIDHILDTSTRAYDKWHGAGFAERAGWLNALAAQLRAQADALAELMSVEMGKPLAQGKGEVEKCAWACEYYAESAETMLQPENIPTAAAQSGVVYRPLGPVLAIMPWNFPLWQVFRFVAPAVMAGNTAILRHSDNVTGCAFAIEKLFKDAGVPEHLLTLVLVDHNQAADIIRDPRVAAVTLTGSVAAGRAVGAAAGGAIKKLVLELGGSDPYVVLEDADLELAVQRCVTSRMINGGQSCVAAKRFIVDASCIDAFTDAFVEQMGAKRMDDPLSAGVDIGPLARERNRNGVHSQVQASIKSGANCVLGGEVPDMVGYFYPPTVLTGVQPGMAAFDEELFGPVAAIIAANGESDAIRLANQTCFGLGAAVFTGDVEHGREIAANQLNAGCCFVNDFVRSDPRLPFGGIKDSGYGRELGSFGIHEFVNAKTVYVA